MGHLRGIFFDLDDTLIDSTGAMRAAIGAIQPLVPENSPTEIAAALTHAYHQLWGYGTPGYPALKTIATTDLRHQLTRAALGALGITSTTRLTEIQQTYEAAEHAALRALPSTRETLKTLQPHFSLGIITNGPSNIQREKLAQVGLTEFFDVIVADVDFGAPKPDPELFEYARKLIGLPSSELLFVGDSPEADIAGASAAGWRSVLFRGVGSSEASFCIEKLEEILLLPPVLETKHLHLAQRSPIL
ncbi:HAD family hydrolase [Armatimonas sp.]|uniref:HAD family hydrolase n=1 Tax=Armatimonas sp. TaxID=1872638 RepID=UPI00286AE6DA|nr:HAD family hydrolase [Armatimonas sp.]